jgi:hypothetical protein
MNKEDKISEIIKFTGVELDSSDVLYNIIHPNPNNKKLSKRRNLITSISLSKAVIENRGHSN